MFNRLNNSKQTLQQSRNIKIITSQPLYINPNNTIKPITPHILQKYNISGTTPRKYSQERQIFYNQVNQPIPYQLNIINSPNRQNLPIHHQRSQSQTNFHNLAVSNRSNTFNNPVRQLSPRGANFVVKFVSEQRKDNNFEKQTSKVNVKTNSSIIKAQTENIAQQIKNQQIFWSQLTVNDEPIKHQKQINKNQEMPNKKLVQKENFDEQKIEKEQVIKIDKKQMMRQNVTYEQNTQKTNELQRQKEKTNVENCQHQNSVQIYRVQSRLQIGKQMEDIKKTQQIKAKDRNIQDIPEKVEIERFQIGQELRKLARQMGLFSERQLQQRQRQSQQINQSLQVENIVSYKDLSDFISKAFN